MGVTTTYLHKLLLPMFNLRDRIFPNSYVLYLISCSLFLIISACDLPNEPGPQPTKIINTKFEPGLNVFGVLRLDDSTGTSFFRVERAYMTEETNVEFSPLITDAKIRVKTIEDTTTYIFSFIKDSIRGDIYTNGYFIPEEGKEYMLTVTAQGFPELTATTVIPVRPTIDSTTLVISDRSVSFDLLTIADTNAYDFYLIFPKDTLRQRVVNQGNERISIHFDLSLISKPLRLIEVYRYDTNLSEYLTSPVAIKPQIYQETVTTVSGGYGCFGSLAKIRVIIE